MSKKASPLENLAQIGQRMVLAREKAGLSQGQAAERSGLSQQNISRYEAGKIEPPAGVLLSLSKIYNVSVDWLLTGQAKADPANIAPGHALIRLPRGDPKALLDDEAELLEKALQVLRAQGTGKSFAETLVSNINASHKGVLLASQVEGPRGRKAAGGNS